MPVLVADVSHWQPPNVPWGDLYIDGVRGMFAQVTHGDFVDAGAFKHIEYAASAGVLTGLYHWLVPGSQAFMENQARLFAAQIQPSWRGRVAIDIEEDGLTGPMVDQFLSALYEIHIMCTVPIIIYTRKEWWEAAIGLFQDFRWHRYDLWAAGGPGYDQRETQPPAGYAAPIPHPWTKAVLEQFTGHGRLAGYDGDLDLSLYRGTEAEFIDWWMLTGGIKVPTYTDAQVQQLSDSTVTIMAETRKIMAILHPGPPAPLPLHSMTWMTNQAVINIFSRTFGSLATLEAQLSADQKATLYANRLATYSGPAVEQMPTLTDAQKASIIAALPIPQAQG